MNHTTLGLIAILTAATLVIGTLAAASPAFASLSAKRIKQRHQLTDLVPIAANSQQNVICT